VEQNLRTRWWVLLAVFILALGARLELVRRLPSNDTVFEDRPYREYAQNLAAGRGFWMPNPYGKELGIDRVYAFRSPLFPLLWGCVYNVTRGAYWPIRTAHAVLGALACLIAVFIAREIAPGRRGAILAGLLCALYPPLIWHSVHLMTEPLFIFFSAMCIYALLRFRRTARWRWLLLAGLAAGLGALSRSMLVGFLPVMALWLWWVCGRGKKAILRAAVFTAVVTLVMAPWIIRNALLLHAFVPTTTDAGHGIYVANNERSLADPRGFHKPHDWGFLLQPGEERISEVEAYRRLTRLGQRYLLGHPTVAARLMANRFVTFWRFYPNPRFITDRRKIVVYAGSYVPLFLLMLPGVWLLHRRAGERLPALLLVDLLVGYTVVIHTAVLAMLRYRVPLMPFLLIFSAAAIAWLWEKAAPGISGARAPEGADGGGEKKNGPPVAAGRP